MARPLERVLDDLEAGCPTCGEEPADAQVRGREIVLVPCGHTIDGTAVLGMSIPDEARDSTGAPGEER